MMLVAGTSFPFQDIVSMASIILADLLYFLAFINEFQKCFCDSNTIVGNRRSFYAISVDLIAKDADLMTVKQDFGYNFVCELGVALDRNILLRQVHSLHGADVVRSE